MVNSITPEKLSRSITDIPSPALSVPCSNRITQLSNGFSVQLHKKSPRQATYCISSAVTIENGTSPACYTPTSRFRHSPATPQRLITKIGFHLNLRKIKNAAKKSPVPIQFKCSIWRPCPLNITIPKIDRPAEAMSATTAGRRLANTLCNTETSLYR